MRTWSWKAAVPKAPSWDERHLEDPTVVDRTVFVDTGDVSTLDFSLWPALRNDLVDRGRAAARSWIEARPEERGPHECGGLDAAPGGALPVRLARRDMLVMAAAGTAVGRQAGWR